MDKKKKDKEMKEHEIKEFDQLHAPTLKRAVSYSSKAFFVDALKKMVENQIITPYTKDTLLGFLDNGKAKIAHAELLQIS